ncbi:hypothetical protein LUZ60_010746 [Juncus effusus]|nr:hypothetical protein LUZ60_010746 [Juncus effusus]
MAKGSHNAQMNAIGANPPSPLKGLLTKALNKTATQSPAQPIRAFHTGRVLSGPVANRPLSPHLPIKKPQFSATFSISHRIFGMALGTVIMAVPLAVKFSHQFDV